MLEIPAVEGGSITGSIDDCWRNALEDAFLDLSYQSVFAPPFTGHWALPAGREVADGMPNFVDAPDAYPVDGRGGDIFDGQFQCQA